MVFRPGLLIAGAAFVAIASGCRSEKPAREPASYAQYRQTELESERQEFITEARARLDTLDREIAHLETKLQHESQFVDADQRAEWSQDLFEKKQKQGELRAELYRAQTVSPEEWEEMRGNFGTALDSMEAGVKKLRDEMMAVFTDEEGEAPEGMAKLRADAGLCPVDIEEADADVEKTNTSVVVVVTTDRDEMVQELQRKAADFAKQDAYSPASGDAGTGAPGVVPVQIAAANVEDGVRLTFVPTYSGHLDQLHAQLEQDADQLGKDRCEIGPGVTGMR